MKLTKQQKEVNSLLKKYDNIIILAPRRSGKTFLIKHIIEKNKDKKIGIIAKFNPEVYREYKNVSTYQQGKKYYLVIGDEDIVVSDKNKTISLGTYSNNNDLFSKPFKSVFIVRWSLDDCPWIDKVELERITKNLPKEILKREFFI